MGSGSIVCFVLDILGIESRCHDELKAKIRNKNGDSKIPASGLPCVSVYACDMLLLLTSVSQFSKPKNSHFRYLSQEYGDRKGIKIGQVMSCF